MSDCILSTSKTQAKRELEKILGKHPGKFFCHHCDNPLCKNPDHIFIGTNSDNMKDMFNKGRNTTFAGWNKGMFHSEETKKKMSESSKRVCRTEEYRKKMSEISKRNHAERAKLFPNGKERI